MRSLKSQLPSPRTRWRRQPFRPFLERLEPRLTPANVDVLRAHYDNLLSGWNSQETALTPANVSAANFGKLFSQPVDGYVYAQPLYKANLAIPGKGTHNVAFVVTEHDGVYAFDADSNTGVNAAPLWQRSLIDPAHGITPVDFSDVMGNPYPETGITGTPVIDAAGSTMYLVAKTKEVRTDGTHFVQRLHALDLATGADKIMTNGALLGDTTGDNNNTSPISVPGRGDGSVNGMVTFNARKELQRPALELVNGVVYMAFASHFDNSPYHGWVIGYNAATLQPAKWFNDTPNTGLGGIWESGGGLGYDAQGNLYFATGNGLYAGGGWNPSQGSYPESVLKLSTTGQLTVADYFTPYDWNALDLADADLGSGGTILLPDAVGSTAHRQLIVETGKTGRMYLMDRNNLGKNNSPNGPDLNLQTVSIGGPGVWGNAAFFQDQSNSGLLYYWGTGVPMQAYRVTNAAMTGTPVTQTDAAFGYPGSQPSISSSGSANGIAWALEDGGPGGREVLHAYNALNLHQELYTSEQTSFRDQLTGGVLFTFPIVSNGHVLVGSQYSFSVFGLFDPHTTPPAAPANLAAAAVSDTQIKLTWTNPTPNNATGIKIERSPNGTNWGQVAIIPRDATAFTDSGLSASTQYFYRIRATNQRGDSPYTASVAAVTRIAPSVLQITNVCSTEVDLSWAGVARDHYELFRSVDGGSFTQIGTFPPARTSYADTAVARGHAYTYHVRAVNVNPPDSSDSAVVQARMGPVVVSYPFPGGFPAQPLDLQANVSAKFIEGTARLTDLYNQAGSVFTTSRVNITGFQTTFYLHLHEGTQPNPADGLTFTLQANSPAAVGGSAAGLGYAGLGNSVALKFDIFNNAGETDNSTGLFVSGDTPTVAHLPGEVNHPLDPTIVNLRDQHRKRIDLAYDGAARKLTETMTDEQHGTGTNAITFTYDVDIPAILSGSTAYAGFTGGTGSNFSLQDILGWTFTETRPGAPAALRAASPGAGQITLSWKCGSSDEDGFIIERSTDGGATFVEVGRSGAGVTTFTDTRLAGGTYLYRARAFNSGGPSDVSNVVAFTLPAGDRPPVITGITRSASLIKKNGTFTLTGTFTDPDAGKTHTAVIHWGDGSTDTTLSLAAGVFRFSASHPYTNGTLAGSNYAIQVTVRDSNGGSDTVNLTATSASAAVPAGLVSWWSGDGYGATVPDIAGTNSATAGAGVTYAPGQAGNAFRLDGTDSAVIPVPDAPTLDSTAGATWDLWVRTSMTGVSTEFMSKHDATGSGNGVGLGMNPNGIPFVYLKSNIGSYPSLGGSFPINDGSFHHLAATFRASGEMSFYVDGQPMGTVATPAFVFSPTPLRLGRSNDPFWAPFRGLLDEAHVFNRMLSAAEIKVIADAGSAGLAKGVTVVDRPPVLTGVSRSAFAIPVNGTLTLGGSFTDVGAPDVHTASIHWGDGSADTTLALAAGTFSFSASHAYPSEGAYPIRVTVRDAAGNSEALDLPAGVTAFVPPTGMVDGWTGDGTTAAAVDIAGTNPAVLGPGVTYAPGLVGNAFRFDGTEAGYVAVADAPSLDNTTATWDLWVQTTQAGVHTELIEKHDAGASVNGVGLFLTENGVPVLYIKSTDGGNFPSIGGSVPVNDGQFHHLAVTFRAGGPMALYIDGQLQGTATTPAFTFSATPLRLGRSNDGFWAPFRGLLDEVHIFNRVLPTDEIRDIVRAGSAGLIRGVTAYATLTAGGSAVSANRGTLFTGQVATFTSANASATPADFSSGSGGAAIDWGDGLTSDGTISQPGGHGTPFLVNGSHLYAAAGAFTIRVGVRSRFGGTAAATSTATVVAVPLITGLSPSAHVISANDLFTLTVAYQEPGSAVAHTATVHWGDGTPDTSLHFNPATGAQSFSTSHRYLVAGNYSITVMVAADGRGGDMVTLGTAVSALAPPAGLVSWWSGDGNTITAPDLAGSNPGTLGTGAGYASGLVGNAFRFDGTAAGYVEVPDAASLNLTNGATWDFWVKTSQAGASVGFMAKHDVFGSLNGVTLLMEGGGTPGVQVKGPDFPHTSGIGSSVRINDGQFHHIALTFQSGGPMSLYVDGLLQGTTTAPVFHFNATPLRLGRTTDGFWAPLKGQMDEVQVYGRMLSAAEIQAIHDAGSAGQVKGVRVSPASTSTSVTASLVSPVYGQALTFTATVATAGGPVSTGTVTFREGTTILFGPVSVDAGGQARFTTSTLPAGPHTITATYNGTASYLTSSGSITRTVSKAPLTITADDKTKVAGDPIPPLTASYSGFVNGDTPASLTTQVSLSTTATQSSPVGTYPITASGATSPNYSITFVNGTLTIVPAAASRFVVTGYPSPTTAGDAQAFMVTALDAYGNVATGYTGTVTFTSNDDQAALPDDYTFTAADGGTQVFTATLFTAGTQSLTVTDTATSSITGSQTGIVVTPAPADHFVIDAPTASTAGVAFDITVTAVDPYGNIDTNYTGTVTFTSTDPSAVVPPDYTFTPGAGGVHTFAAGATLFQAGDQDITATDVDSGISGTATVTVSAAAVDHFQVDAPAEVAASTPFDVTVTALDAYGNTVAGYMGTVHFSSTDQDPGVMLPADYSFTAEDAGVHTFAGGVTLVTPGDQTVTVTDPDNGFTGSADITVMSPHGGPRTHDGSGVLLGDLATAAALDSRSGHARLLAADPKLASIPAGTALSRDQGKPARWSAGTPRAARTVTAVLDLVLSHWEDVDYWPDLLDRIREES